MPTRLSGTTGQDLQRLQSGQPTPISGAGQTPTPMDLIGQGAGIGPPPVPSGSPAPIPLENPVPGAGEPVTSNVGPPLNDPSAELHPTTQMLLDAATQGDPQAVGIIDSLIRMIEEQNQGEPGLEQSFPSGPPPGL